MRTGRRKRKKMVTEDDRQRERTGPLSFTSFFSRSLVGTRLPLSSEHFILVFVLSCTLGILDNFRTNFSKSTWEEWGWDGR